MDATFECWHHRPDDMTQSFTECSPPHTLPELADGGWVFEVRSLDAAIPDAVPASRAFAVEAANPDTTITSRPPDLSNDRTPELAFSSTEAGTFKCRHYRQGE